MSFRTLFASVYRDYVTDGVPASGANEPVKSEIRAIGTAIDTALGTLSLGSVSVTKDTRAHLNSDLAHAADSTALVYADATDANNDIYVKVGATGTGSWTLTTILHDVIAALVGTQVVDQVQPLVDDAAASAAGASSDADRAETARDAAEAALATGGIAAEALTGFVGTPETIGIAPASDTASTAGFLVFINTAATYDSTLDSFKAYVRSVGNGTARLVAVMNGIGSNIVVVIGSVALTGIASTGVKTFSAGVDYNLLDANGQPIVFPAGTRFALGSVSGGATFDCQVSTGAGSRLVATAGGYSATQDTGTNFIGKFQVTLGRIKSVRAAMDALAGLPVAVPGESLITEYQGPDSLVFFAGDQSDSFYFGNDLPFYNDGKITGVQYAGASAGDVLWVVWRGNQIVDWRRATIAVGDRLTSTFTSPFAVKAGDKLDCLPISGYLKSQNWSAQPGRYSNSNLAWNGATFVALNKQPAMRAVLQRARKPRRIAAASSRGQTVTVDQRFRGATLPGNTTFTATTTNGSYVLTGITGTPVAGSPISGTGLTALASPYIVSVSGNTALMSQPATASGSITVTQSGWAAASGSGWACSDGLTWTGGTATTDWTRRYMFPVPINAQRRSFSAAVYIGDLTNIIGLCSDAQQASVVTDLGSYIHIDAPANTFRAYQAGANVGLVPPDAGLSVAAPWALAATDWVLITTQIDRGKQTITFTNAKTGQSAQIVSRFAKGVNSRPIHAGVFSGKPGVHFLQGAGGWKVDFARNITHVSNRGPRKFWFHDSTCHLTSDNWDYNWANRVEDQRGKGDFLNFAKGGQTALGMLATLPQDFAAMNPGPGDEVFIGVGVNVDNDLGTTAANRYSAYKRSILAAINTFTQAGCTVTLVTPTPSDALSTYVPLVISGQLTGDLGNYLVVDVGRAVSPLGDGATWTPLFSQDGLHDFEPTGGAVIAANFLSQRADMNGDI